MWPKRAIVGRNDSDVCGPRYRRRRRCLVRGVVVPCRPPRGPNAWPLGCARGCVALRFEDMGREPFGWKISASPTSPEPLEQSACLENMWKLVSRPRHGINGTMIQNSGRTHSSLPLSMLCGRCFDCAAGTAHAKWRVAIQCDQRRADGQNQAQSAMPSSIKPNRHCLTPTLRVDCGTQRGAEYERCEDRANEQKEEIIWLMSPVTRYLVCFGARASISRNRPERVGREPW